MDERRSLRQRLTSHAIDSALGIRSSFEIHALPKKILHAGSSVDAINSAIYRTKKSMVASQYKKMLMSGKLNDPQVRNSIRGAIDLLPSARRFIQDEGVSNLYYEQLALVFNDDRDEEENEDDYLSGSQRQSSLGEDMDILLENSWKNPMAHRRRKKLVQKKGIDQDFLDEKMDSDGDELNSFFEMLGVSSFVDIIDRGNMASASFKEITLPSLINRITIDENLHLDYISSCMLDDPDTLAQLQVLYDWLCQDHEIDECTCANGLGTNCTYLVLNLLRLYGIHEVLLHLLEYHWKSRALQRMVFRLAHLLDQSSKEKCRSVECPAFLKFVETLKLVPLLVSFVTEEKGITSISQGVICDLLWNSLEHSDDISENLDFIMSQNIVDMETFFCVADLVEMIDDQQFAFQVCSARASVFLTNNQNSLMLPGDLEWWNGIANFVYTCELCLDDFENYCTALKLELVSISRVFINVAGQTSSVNIMRGILNDILQRIFAEEHQRVLLISLLQNFRGIRAKTVDDAILKHEFTVLDRIRDFVLFANEEDYPLRIDDTKNFVDSDLIEMARSFARYRMENEYYKTISLSNNNSKSHTVAKLQRDIHARFAFFDAMLQYIEMLRSQEVSDNDLKALVNQICLSCSELEHSNKMKRRLFSDVKVQRAMLMEFYDEYNNL